MDQYTGKAKLYWNRAVEVRTELEKITSTNLRNVLLDVAVGYERLANTLHANDARRRTENSN